MRALTWQINGRVKYLIGIMLITRWLQNSLAHTSTDHICQHSAKPQKPKEPAIKVRGVFGVRKVKTKNPHHNLARVCRPLTPLRPPKNPQKPPGTPRKPMPPHFLLPADAACAGGKQTLHNFDCISVSYAQKGGKQAGAAAKSGDSNRKFRLFPFVYLCSVP